ncbi:hypothetical protein Glove_395g27 [Diversispora epigaea]|uniref:DNA repair protein RAD52 n=1 Tax=Diversispora epigaea TaxID=1348612 RepID=A0A397H509_9GLOM|nr:hypothetical protein Glove_395g27 [Diversispora epigaea]
MVFNGDQQNRSNNNNNNNQFPHKEEKVIQATLNKQVGPEFLSNRLRTGGGGKEVCINIANNLFGFNGWSHKIENLTVDFVDCEAGNYSVGVSATCKVILKDGTFHMDVGYGSADKMKNKSMALEKAKKEAVADALKRTLRKFGNFLA